MTCLKCGRTNLPSAVQCDCSRGAPSESTSSGFAADSQAGQDVREEADNGAGRDMLFGGLWCLGGILFTVFSYQSAASSGGGTYYIAYGAVIIGAIQFLRGLIAAGRD